MYHPSGFRRLQRRHLVQPHKTYGASVNETLKLEFLNKAE